MTLSLEAGDVAVGEEDGGGVVPELLDSDCQVSPGESE